MAFLKLVPKPLRWFDAGRGHLAQPEPSPISRSASAGSSDRFAVDQPRPALGKEAFELVGRHRPPEQVALAEVAAEALERAQLSGRLDPLRDRDDAERVREVDQVRRDRGVLRIVL